MIREKITSFGSTWRLCPSNVKVLSAVFSDFLLKKEVIVTRKIPVCFAKKVQWTEIKSFCIWLLNDGWQVGQTHLEVIVALRQIENATPTHRLLGDSIKGSHSLYNTRRPHSGSSTVHNPKMSSAQYALYNPHASVPRSNLIQPKSETSILTMKGGSPGAPQSPVFINPSSFQSPSPNGSQSQLYIEVRQSPQGFISPNGVTQITEIKSEPQPCSPTFSTTSQSSLTSQNSFDNLPQQHQYLHTNQWCSILKGLS